MTICINNRNNHFRVHFKAKPTVTDKETILKCIEHKHPNNLEYYKNYYNIQIPRANMDKLKALKITNFREIENNNCRGESLSAKRNRGFLPIVKQYGIEHIIDLRTADYTDKFREICTKYGFKYIHLPIDARKTPDRQIIDQLPELFEALDNGNCYIACAQGLHRTDIALAMNYLFNPKHPQQPPRMYGHLKEGHMRSDDILSRANSIMKNLTPEDKAKLNWTPEFEEGFKVRKQKLVQFNET